MRNFIQGHWIALSTARNDRAKPVKKSPHEEGILNLERKQMNSFNVWNIELLSVLYAGPLSYVQHDVSRV